MDWIKAVKSDYESCKSCGSQIQEREAHPDKNEMIWICKKCNWVSGRVIVCSVEYMNALRSVLNENSSR